MVLGFGFGMGLGISRVLGLGIRDLDSEIRVWQLEFGV